MINILIGLLLGFALGFIPLGMAHQSKLQLVECSENLEETTVAFEYCTRGLNNLVFILEESQDDNVD